MDTGSLSENRTLAIRKYPNRRYYDATRSQHVKLEEIHELIRQGYEVQVTDSKTGQDITAKVLAQIILELDPPKLDIFPSALLHRLIRANEKLLQDFTEKYFNRALDCFLQSQKQFETYLRQAVGLPSGSSDWARMFNPFMNPFWGSLLTDGNGSSGGPALDSTEQLQKRILELQAQMERLQKKSAPETVREA
jgi:polyhydroxyalkanoate synthesis repressor PhaR